MMVFASEIILISKLKKSLKLGYFWETEKNVAIREEVQVSWPMLRAKPSIPADWATEMSFVNVASVYGYVFPIIKWQKTCLSPGAD